MTVEATPELPDRIAVAITALTAAAREAGLGQEHDGSTGVVDFGAVLCGVVTAVAANLGGVEQLLACRPGSWEADHIRRIVLSTAGEDEIELARHRTEPLRVWIDVDWEFERRGLHDLYDEAAEAIAARDATAQEALFEAMATPQERERFARLAGVRLFTAGATPEQIESRRALLEERRDLWTKLIDRAVGSPCAAALEQVDRVSALLDGLWEQDRANYRMALVSAVRQRLAELGAHDLLVELHDQPQHFDPLSDHLHEYASTTTVMTIAGRALGTTSTAADDLRSTGKTYLDRLN